MKTLALCAALCVAAWGCDGLAGSGSIGPTDLDKSLSLLAFESCDQLESEIKQIVIGEMEKNLDGYKAHCRYEAVPGPIDEPESGGDDSTFQSNAAGTTETNLQEEGVDEADLIKTDGQYAYAIVGDEVKVVRVWPFDQFGLVATIKPEESPKGLYLADHNLIVLSDDAYEGSAADASFFGPFSLGSTVEEVFDVSNPSQPVLTKRVSYAGELLNSRRIDSSLYLILSMRGVDTPDFDYDLQIDYQDLPPCPEDGQPKPNQALLNEIERLKKKNRAMVEGMGLDKLMPDVGPGKELGCSEIMRCTAASGTSLLTVVTDSFGDGGAQPTKSSILSNGGEVYASREALYIASSSMTYGWWMIPEYDFEDATVIHRFALEGGQPFYTGSNEVEGHLVDNFYAGSRYSTRFSMAQFAMSEHDGYLRVATTVDEFSEGQFSRDNRVTVLDADSPDLEQLGQVGGMGSGERIYSVRFVGPRGYVVTFKKVDPLYVVDLSQPASPRIAGELKVPGFSTYLHPMDDGHLIGLGFGADDEDSFAWTQGLKLALFDVSDPNDPAEVGNREIGTRGSYSPAIEEHHAFTLDRGRGMLALPVEIYEGSDGGSDFGAFSYAGVLLLKADLTGAFETVGRIVMDSADKGDQPSWWGFSKAEILRTVIIGDGEDDGVITLTKYSVRLNRIDDTMSEVGTQF